MTWQSDITHNTRHDPFLFKGPIARVFWVVCPVIFDVLDRVSLHIAQILFNINAAHIVTRTERTFRSSGITASPSPPTYCALSSEFPCNPATGLLGSSTRVTWPVELDSGVIGRAFWPFSPDTVIMQQNLTQRWRLIWTNSLWGPERLYGKSWWR